MITAAEVRSPADETRLRILAATRTIFALNGTRGTTTREIAERAGVNEATIFRHFGSKHALLAAMREHFCVSPQLKTTLDTLHGELDADLQTIGLAMMQGIEKNEDLIRISFAEENLDPHGSAVPWRAPIAIHEMLVEYMEGRVASHELRGAPADLARYFMGVIFSHVMARRLWFGKRPPDREIVRFCVDVFLNGVRTA